MTDPKQCSKCKEVKPLDEFYRNKHSKDGHCNQCKECRRKYVKSEAGKRVRRNYEARHLKKRFDENIFRKCNNPDCVNPHTRKDGTLHISHFYKMKFGKYGRTAQCKECTKIKTSEYYHGSGNEVIRAYIHSPKGRKDRRGADRRRAKDDYRKQQKARANVRRENRKRGNGGSFTEAEWRALCKHYGNKCLCCGGELSYYKLTVDHVVPVSRGGTSNIDNLQPLCRPCNTKKGTDIIDYRTKKVWWEQLSLF